MSKEGFRRYTKQAVKGKVLSTEAELKLARQYKRGDRAAGDKLIAANLRFALKEAHRYARRGYEIEDLVQEANLGLMLALERFNPNRGVRFITYARWWVMARLNTHCFGHSSIVKFGQIRAGRIDKAMRMILKDGAAIDDALDIVAYEANLDREQVRSIWQRRSADMSPDVPLFDGTGATRLDMMTSPMPDPEQAAIDREEAESVAVVVRMAAGSPRERLIVEKRILADDPATLGDLGDRLRCSRERVRQIEEGIRSRVVLRLAK